jgi:hypothetical protein
MTNNPTIQNRQDQNKEKILDHLRKAPIVQVACDRAGVSRATYYRWRKEDEDFLNDSDDALAFGRRFISDMAESQLISAIKDQNMTAIIFWLKNHDPSYKQKVELSGQVDTKPQDPMTPEQEQAIKRALQIAKMANNLPTIPSNNVII